MSTTATIQANLEKEINELQTIQKDFSNIVSSRAKLESQLQENEMVLTEFGHLQEDSKVYKLIGPALVVQDKVEANTNVKDRIELIKSEISRAEKTIKELEAKQDSKRKIIFKLQQDFQQLRSTADPKSVSTSA